MTAMSPWQISLGIHGLLAGAALFLFLLKPSLPPEVINVPVVEVPEEAAPLKPIEVKKPSVVLKSVNEPKPDSSTEKAREVYGMNRRSYTDETVSDAEAVTAKKGNTLAKEQDEDRLLDSDPDSLPTPTEEYLVSEMPQVLSEVKPTYPPEAREKRIEGDVVLDILIDQSGIVRDAKVVEGERIFWAGALAAIKNFKFKPAKVDGESVAVRIQYRIVFELEY